MALLNVANDAFSTLAAGIASTATSLTVATGEGARFPTSNFHITIGSEIMLCTTRTGDVFTLPSPRNREGTTAAAHLAGAAVELRVTAQTLTQLYGSITSGWELIRTRTFTNDINITGLDGNADRLWMLVISINRTTAGNPSLRFNSDGVPGNYFVALHRQGRWAGASVHSVTDVGASSIQLLMGGLFVQLVDIIIDVTNGKSRVISFNGFEKTDNLNLLSISGGGVWINTTDNITVINILTGGPVATGEYWLFRRRV